MPSLAAVGLAGLEYMERTRPWGAVCCDSRQDQSALLRRNDYGKGPTFSREASFSSSLEVQLWWRGLGGGFLRGVAYVAKSTTRPRPGQAGAKRPTHGRLKSELPRRGAASVRPSPPGRGCDRACEGQWRRKAGQGRVPQRKRVKFHYENAPSSTMEMRQVPQRH